MDERTNENYSDDAAFKRDREQNKQTPTPFIRPMSSGQFGVVAKISLVANQNATNEGYCPFAKLVTQEAKQRLRARKEQNEKLYVSLFACCFCLCM